MNEMKASKGKRDYDIEHYITLITTERIAEQNYHNHKETMAWVATALYLLAIFSTAHYFCTYITQIHESIAYTVVSVLATISFLIFIVMQFAHRWKAADTVKGLMKALAQLLSNEISLNKDNTNSVEVEKEKGHGFYPKFVKEAIDASSTDRLKELKKIIRFNMTDSRAQTELASYFLIFLALLVANLIIWKIW